MTICETKAALAEALSGSRPCDINFVPTMGALHEGHLSLVAAARRAADFVAGSASGGSGSGKVVVSIFVNPTQFNDPADLRAYPRTPERDLAMLEQAGVDVVFMPTVEEIYPDPGARELKLGGRWDFGELDKVMEGATRPGHFNGVAQVVSRLFELVRPTRAMFGQKDFQQVAIVREMVRQAASEGEPWAAVEIVECPIVREADGLAMSSRNALLTPEHRAAAPDIYRALELGRELFAKRGAALSREELADFVKTGIERSGLLKTIYFDFMGTHACVAVQAGGVRLIDNLSYDN